MRYGGGGEADWSVQASQAPRRRTALRPRNHALEIRVHEQFRSDLAVGGFNHDYLKSGFSAVLHGGNAVRVVGYQNDAVNAAMCRVRGNVEADPHIDTFLLKVGNEIGVGKLGDWIDRRMFRFVSAEFQAPRRTANRSLRARSSIHLSEPANV